jgi:hypothetical protein
MAMPGSGRAVTAHREIDTQPPALRVMRTKPDMRNHEPRVARRPAVGAAAVRKSLITVIKSLV